ncbi:hypothetical protein BEL04_12910 [Mucilaginibacter sp. PPCGB 2223]|nr:hypothetical protein BEL04_12910 [Mucilaginibacter sp. PPCGB 2223]
MLNELTQEQFEGTMISPMVNVTESAEAIVDIWPYIEQLVNNHLVNQYVYDNGLVEFVYRNGTNTYEHILLPTADKNTFVIIVVDILKSEILGHHRLDLGKLYGLN